MNDYCLDSQALIFRRFWCDGIIHRSQFSDDGSISMKSPPQTKVEIPDPLVMKPGNGISSMYGYLIFRAMNLQFGDFTAIFDFNGDLFIVRKNSSGPWKKLYPQGLGKNCRRMQLMDGKSLICGCGACFMLDFSPKCWLFQSGKFGKMMTNLDLQVPDFLRQTWWKKSGCSRSGVWVRSGFVWRSDGISPPISGQVHGGNQALDSFLGGFWDLSIFSFKGENDGIWV